MSAKLLEAYQDTIDLFASTNYDSFESEIAEYDKRLILEDRGLLTEAIDNFVYELDPQETDEPSLIWSIQK